MLYWRNPNESKTEDEDNISLDDIFGLIGLSTLPDDLKDELSEILGLNNPLTKKFPVGSHVRVKLSEKELVKALSQRCKHLHYEDAVNAAADLVSGKNMVTAIHDLEINGKTSPCILVGNAHSFDVFPFYENEIELE